MLGIEVSCETYIDDTHIVCFGCDWNDPFFKELDDFCIQSKVNNYRQLTEALTETGMPIAWDEVLNNNGNPIPEDQIQKKMIFELMARKGYELRPAAEFWYEMLHPGNSALLFYYQAEYVRIWG